MHDRVRLPVGLGELRGPQGAGQSVVVPLHLRDAPIRDHETRRHVGLAPDGAGAQAAFASVSAAMVERRRKLRDGEGFDVGDFFEGDKGAEADRNRRRRR